MTIEERLVVYRVALVHYQLCKGLFKRKLKKRLHTNFGLCGYFTYVIHPLYGNNVDFEATEIWTHSLNQKRGSKFHGCWFRPGRIRPRIKILEEIIANLENQLFSDAKEEVIMDTV